MMKELSPSEVKFQVDFNKEDKDIKLKDIPQINSAYKKIKRAISIDKENFNLYIVDSFSKYKINELSICIEEFYKDKKSPNDICYVTYEDYRKPEPLFLHNGNGRRLKEEVEKIKNKYFDVVIDFYNTSSDEEKDRIIEEISTKRNDYISELIEMAKDEGFDLKATSSGFAFIPLNEGEAMTEKEYDDLSEDNKDSIILKAGYLKKKAEVILEKLRNMELGSIDKLKEIYRDYLNLNMEEEKQDILLDFITDDAAYDYLESLFTFIERDLVNCYSINIEDDQSEINKIINNYDINVLVDNSMFDRPRVIYEDDPSLINLMGNIEYESHDGSYSTDLSLISPGSILLANEGCLIIRINQLAMNNLSYYALKKVLMSQKVNLDCSKSYLDFLSINGLKPEPIPVNVKVILIGDYETYDALYNVDEDFKSLFPLKVEMPDYIDINSINGSMIKEYINSRFIEYGLTEVSEDAIKEVVRYLCRKADSREKMKVSVDEIDKIVLLVKDFLSEKGLEYVDKEDIIKNIYEEEIFQKDFLDMYKNNKILLSLEGKKVGMISGLAVISSSYFSFGKPVRVTCIASKGIGKIIDVQKESNLSGNIHEKSINILNGILSNMIESYSRLPVDFYVSFEQTYGMLDGDSASVAEMLSILSALSKIGINQNIAVTGSLNLFGEVQAIGGVNEKIEGFYNVCKSLGKTENLGVLIPESNVDELVLIPEVEEAIESGKLHIYVMNTLEDAIEVMLDEDIEGLKSKIKLEIEKYKYSN